MSAGGETQTLSTPLDRTRPPSAEPKGPVIGIDLGVASCKVAIVGRQGPEVVSQGGQPSIAGCIALDPRGHLVVGQPAQRVMVSTPELGVWGPKGLLERFDSPAAAAWRSHSQCPFFELEDGDTAVSLGDRSYTARELVAMLLCEAREWAQNRLGVPVERAVITIAPTLGDRYLSAIEEISRMAGLHLERTLFEPSAVILPMAMRATFAGERTAGILDWSASGFRFSVLRWQKGQSQVLMSDCEPKASGLEIDRWLCSQVLRDSGVEDPEPLQNEGATASRLLGAAEQAKIWLSDRDQYRLVLPVAYYEGGAPRDLDVLIHRRHLEDFVGPLIDRALKASEKVLLSKGLFPGDLEEVYLVGEQSRMPLVQERCRRFFYGVRMVDVDPTAAIVLGAATLAAKCAA